jgi:hypothetical protein
MTKRYEASDIFLAPIAEEQIPTLPPPPQAQWLLKPDDPGMQELLKSGGVRVRASLDYDLLRCAWRLSELAHRFEGGYRQGHELPQSAVAASAGAIALACAAFEAALNETIDDAKHSASDAAGAQLLGLLVGLTPRDRLAAFAGFKGHVVSWGSEPFQSLNALLAVRKQLLHAEPALVEWDQGHWPAPVLKDLPRRIGSPYPVSSPATDLPLGWDVHVLTPAGAEWAVQTVVAVVKWLEDIKGNEPAA